MVAVDYLVVGSGLTGSVIARTLHDARREVLVLERRNHAGGNVHDYQHGSGLRIHTYGPHYFRTSSERIWTFVKRFGDFYRYEACLQTRVDGRYELWPVNSSYLRKHSGHDWEPEFRGTPNNFEEAALSLMPRIVYERFVKEYNEKQWGVPATTLSADLCRRFTVRRDDDPGLVSNKRYQGIPVRGYAQLMEEMTKGIPSQLNCDYLEAPQAFHARKLLIYTGPIDAFFGHELGRLKYRGQQRVHRYYPDEMYLQPCAQVNNPQHAGGAHIRTLEWKHLVPADSARAIRGTVLTTETPYTPVDVSGYEYPFPDPANAELYRRYRQRAAAESGVLVCGRLGEYRYYDMDQAIGRALWLAQRILDRTTVPEFTG